MHSSKLVTAVAASAVLALPAIASAAPITPVAPAQSSLSSDIEQVKIRRVGPRGRVVVKPGKVVKSGKYVVVKPRPGRYAYRAWNYRPHYGTIVAGIAIGTIIGVAIANAAPPRPSSDLCWYWSNRDHTKGYWDYCE